ncbi:homoserine dehydrogenase [Pseudoxanthomonas sp.]|uniref:homoserine dehydrogenase n=1 Tax=Pseudoxanthomonas sp. TaxID=1871049 RepID=UPI002629E52B|nr:homoserine dehydrogenase [Pseudoxanthomonas sp.]WDS37659.1 MAG: homoserine dehydrogenase [Pseudoxanthomonas sp.]
MSAVVRLNARRAPRLALLGTGVVGAALIARYQRLQVRGVALPAFAWIANSREVIEGDRALEAALQQLRDAPANTRIVPPWAEADALDAGDIVIDATASDAIALRHAEWLGRGVHVVTANKLGAGADLLRAQAIEQAARDGGAVYGDSATVGAGLPLLRSLRALVAGGDAITSVEGVLSGSLAWLFNQFDGTQAFSSHVRQARTAGYTEPDPRIDLSGEDVRRKLLILARAAGLPLQRSDVRVESLVPQVLANASHAQIDDLLSVLDAPLQEQLDVARRDGAQLRLVGRFDAQGASVGLRALPASHALCGGGGTDNRVAIHCDRYPDQPLLIQGPGAGAEVTAAALLDDVLALLPGSREQAA